MKLQKNILEIIVKKNRVWRFLGLILGCFILAIIYNSFAVPNNLVYGGIGGLAIIVNDLTGISVTLFLNIVSFSLIIISFLTLGAKMTSYSLVGYVMYILMINITEPLTQYINFNFDSFLLSIFITALIYGFGSGLVYRMGFNTGGSDSIAYILQHFLKIPHTKISAIVNGIIIILATYIFGIEKTLYSIVFLKISNFVSEHTILGSSDSKICFIKSKKTSSIEELITNEMGLGYSMLESTNGIGILKKEVIFCVIPSELFYDFKENVLKIDKKAMFISNDCYTVEGGTINYLFPV